MTSFLERLRRQIHFHSRPKPTPDRVEESRLRALPRRAAAQSSLLGPVLYMPDALSFLGMKEEIFERGIYKFRSPTATPRILDCGANIGVSVIFLKQLYPQAKITAFEPDPAILDYLRRNLSSAGLADVTVVPMGVWSSAGSLRFFSEGSDAGRIAPNEKAVSQEIPTIRLKDYLNEPIDFLKIDIEGAETEVLRDCSDQLAVVRNIFVEYHSFANQTQTLPELLSILQRAGFHLHIQTIFSSPQPFTEIETNLGMDLQLNVYGRRVNQT